MRLKCLIVALFLLHACHSMAQLAEQPWPEVSCSTDAVVVNFVELPFCVEPGIFSRVQVLAGKTPAMVFEQGAERFDAIYYEVDAQSLRILAQQLSQETAWQALDTLFALPGKKHKSVQEQLLLQVFDIQSDTRLSAYTLADYRAYIRVNPEAADNTIFITETKTNTLYRLVGNFDETQAIHWLSRLDPATGR